MSYYDPRAPSSFRGAYLQRKKAWLKGQDPYTLHFPIRKNFKRERVYVSGINSQFQADLMDLQSLAKFNRGYRYVVAVICVFSKYAWMIPIKKKTGVEMVSAFRRIFRERLPTVLQSDSGTEFTNRHFQSFLKSKKVRFFSTKSELKSSVIERFIRTMKAVIWRYFTKNKTSDYVSALDDFTHSYNHTYHRSIRMPPANVNYENQHVVRETLYGDEARAKEPDLTPGTAVRISKIRNRFEKSSVANWQSEIFYVSEAMSGNPPMYRIRDYNGEPIEGRFYREELQAVKPPEFWQIERIIKRRRRRNKTQYLVRWLGYGTEFDSWIDENDIRS